MVQVSNDTSWLARMSKRWPHYFSLGVSCVCFKGLKITTKSPEILERSQSTLSRFLRAFPEVALGMLLAFCRERTLDDRPLSDLTYRTSPLWSGLWQTVRSGMNVCAYLKFTGWAANSQRWWCYEMESLWGDEVMRMEPSWIRLILL